MRYFLILAILLFGATVFAQNKTVTIEPETASSPGGTYSDLSFNASDTINESETYWILYNCEKKYHQMQNVWIDIDSVSGGPGVTITLKGRVFDSDSWTTIGTPVVWAGTVDTTFLYSNTTANAYRFYRLEFVADATDQQSLIADVKFKTWLTGGDLSTASLSLSGNLVVTGTSTLTGAVTANGGITLGAGDDLIGSATSDITINTDKFTVAGATGDVIVGNDLDVVGDLTAGTIASDAGITATSGVDLGTSQALVGTTSLTIGAGTQTVAVNSSDWDIGATGDMTGIGAITSDGIITAGAGITNPTESTHIWATGGSVALATSGTDVACSDGARYWTEIMIPNNVTLTGISYLVGSVGGTDSVVVQLCNSAGVEVATSRDVGAAADIVGTAAEFQSVDFDTPYAATAGVYYVAVQFNGTTAKFRTYPIAGSPFVAATAAGTYGTKADITPGTTFTADKGPIFITY